MNPIIPVPASGSLLQQVEALLHQSNIRLDANLDYTCAMLDEGGEIIATGSCFRDTLRCLAVRGDRQGEGLLNQLVTHLTQIQYTRGNTRLFLYTKSQSAKFFHDLGYYEIAAAGTLVFMENRKNGFADYLRELRAYWREGSTAAIVMNANPFTLGHQHLVEQAAAENDTVHLFIVSEDASVVPYDIRRRLVEAGTSHLQNVICHSSGPYIISTATFPSYFLRDQAAVIEGQARIDLAVFCKIAAVLGITRRYVGEERVSEVTGLYNEVMLDELPKAGITCTVIPRRERDGEAISASAVRWCLQQGRIARLAELVPASTLEYFLSPEAEPIIAKIQSMGDVTHY